MHNPLIDYISKFVSLDDNEIQDINSLVEKKSFKAGDILLKEGSISRVSYFNLKGCVRMYYIVDGEEKTTHYYTENQFITSFRSFTNQIPADHYLQCIEDCELALVPYKVEQELLRRYPKLESFARVILETELANYQDMLSSYIISNPESRYKNFIKNHPDLLQRIPLYQLASYLGITAESLSRIRSRILKKSS
jgi:CRP-like cAMP-binding protein